MTDLLVPVVYTRGVADFLYPPFSRVTRENGILDGMRVRDHVLVLLDHYQIEHWRVQFAQQSHFLELAVYPLGRRAVPDNKVVEVFDEHELLEHEGDVRDLIWSRARHLLTLDAPFPKKESASEIRS